MFHIHLRQCSEFLAGDHTRLKELLHPAKASLQIGYSLAHGFVDPGKSSLWHRLKSSEVYYFLSGRGTMRVNEESVAVETGSVVYVPPGAAQSLVNDGPVAVEFLCLVDPAWKPEDEEIRRS
ncbi:MAG TPA: cupin domain-containing protein [Nitrospiraceae bacterium]|jgi:mannose-6-phosphate isomerase-like protein (cupin superfamily)|nr:cupin domain-containing protein [Nitrospiraceae bacterium]